MSKLHVVPYTFDYINEPELLEEIERVGVIHTFQPDDIIIDSDRYVRSIPFIIKGSVKVSRIDQNGKELFLHHISAGQSCAYAIVAYLTHRQCGIKAVAEEETEVIAVPTSDVNRWHTQFPSWRTFVASTLSGRLNELFEAIDTIAFSRTDQRLIAFLSAKSKILNTNIIQITHREIANELSTSREVISRLLKRLEQDNAVKLFRNKIELIPAR